MAEAGLELGRFKAASLPAAAGGHQRLRPASAAQHAVHPRLFVLDLRWGVDQPHVLAGTPARAYNVATIYRAHPMFADADFEYWYPHLGDDGRFQVEDGRSSLEGGDVQPIGNGTVLIGLSGAPRPG